MANTSNNEPYQEMLDTDMDKMTPGGYFGEVSIKYPNPEDPEESISSTFSVYDGIAYSTVTIDGQPREVMAAFPLERFINTKASTMQKKIKDVLNIEEDRDITPLEILQTYGRMTLI